MQILSQIILWIGVFGFWLVVSRGYHPTWLIAILATGVLVAVSALAVTLNHRVLQPGYLNRRRYGQYLTGLICSIILPALVAVLVIGWIYDVLWGPDSMRFGFWQNLAYETIFISVHVLMAMAVIWLARRLRRSDHE